tara:strand:- start:5569 stop:5940 length:372 start_codon:yes stop_codon:yes gene_type:complete
MDKFRIVVAGGRKFHDFERLTYELDSLLRNKSRTHEIVIVSGKARGADELGERYARLRHYSIQSHPANWNMFGNSAGYRRNEEMALESDATVAFWDGESRGTKHMIDITQQHGNMLRIVDYTN